ncbi:hypothetical protein SLS62_000671 [Diatrype stigma]|uniref:Uncharacterized protein n=1 Tax=Diatrype stigma TaxID=117547 RepID=A0AAN9V9Q5_9PEZI
MSRTSIKALLLASLSLKAVAERNTTSYNPSETLGSSNPEMVVGSYEYRLFEEGNAHPNATRSVTFKPFEWFGQEPEIADREWTWQPEFTELGPLIDPHVVNVAYDFSWERGGNMSSALGNSTGPFCVSITSIDYPTNVTNAYTDDNTDSVDCTPVLGEECVNAILRDGANTVGGSYCNGPQTTWSELPECASTIGYASDISQYPGIGTTNLNSGNSTANATINGKTVPHPNRESGDGFYSKSSGSVNGTNTTAYYAATNQLHVVMMDTQLPDSSGSGGGVGRPNLLCMRVNTTILDETDSDEGAGPSVRVSLGMMYTAMLAAVGSVVFFI